MSVGSLEELFDILENALANLFLLRVSREDLRHRFIRRCKAGACSVSFTLHKHSVTARPRRGWKEKLGRARQPYRFANEHGASCLFNPYKYDARL